MKIVPLVRSEFARLTSSRLGIASLVALMTVPVIYGGLYLWGNGDPYGRLDQVPAAVVVQDTGTTVDGESVNYGEDAADELLDGMKFGWVEVTAAEAKAGVTDGTYDFSITFPADFSTDLASASGDDPVDADLVLTTNDINSYLSTTLAKAAAEAVRVAVAKEVGSEASTTLLEAIDSIRTGLVDASDGAATLADGAATAATGAASLASGSASLATGATSLSTGLATLDSSAASLPASAQSLSTGATTVSNGLASVNSGVSKLTTPAQQAAQLSALIQSQVVAGTTVLGLDAATTATITAELQQLSALTAGVNGGLTTLAPNVAALSTGASQVAAGASTLASSAPALIAAIDKASDGAATLAAGATDASTGAASLSSGVTQLADGSATLSSSLADGVADVPATTDEQRASIADTVANPVTVTQDAITEAQNYGAGLAPFFISLSAWIGIYALFLIVRPLSRRALTAVRRPVRTTLAGWATPALLGIVQMLALFGILTLALHLQIANPLGLLGFMALVSITFAAIILALNVLLGSVGQFLGLILMIVQLVTAGGTFPWQTLPGPLAFLHNVLPMSSAVDGVRQFIYGGTWADTASEISTLLAWLAVALVVAGLGAFRQGRTRGLRELRPSAIGG